MKFIVVDDEMKVQKHYHSFFLRIEGTGRTYIQIKAQGKHKDLTVHFYMNINLYMNTV